MEGSPPPYLSLGWTEAGHVVTGGGGGREGGGAKK